MAPKKKTSAKAKANEAAIITGSEALRLKAALDAGQTLDDETLLKLLHADVPCEGLYSKACKSKGQNPNCLCNIIPAPDSSRRVGLWAKNSDVAAGLGFDPSDRRREDPSIPAGLRNLGNTCYVNSVLQCLFANTAFRNAVYAAAPPVSDDPVVKALKELFVQMQQGPASPVDPAPLATALQLDHAVQQDGQEFMKLLLTLLEHRFASQSNLHGVIQNLFRGQSGYETLCMTCQTPSDSSSRSDNFYELDVPVRGFKSLDASLTSLLSPEILEGENQFSCDRCAGKRDATRRLQVRSLPPMLCLSLQRFVYDFVKGDRVKATDKFAFPLELPASALIGGVEQQGREQSLDGSGSGNGDIYDLEAILIHKGGSALQGHYVAHIKLDAAPDGSGGTWWRFDDETVTKMDQGPHGTTDHGGGGGGGAGGAGGSRAGSAAGTVSGSKKKGGTGGAGNNKNQAAGKAGAKGGRGGGKAAAEKKSSTGKKQTSRKKKRNEWSSSENEDDEAISDAAAALFTEEEEIEEEKVAAPARKKPTRGAKTTKPAPSVPSAPVNGDNDVPEIVDLLHDDENEEENKKKTEITSSNAYLLVYRRRGLDLSSPDSGVTLDPGTAQWLVDSKARLAEEFEKQCEAYKTAKADAEMQQTARRQEVRNLLESAAGYGNSKNTATGAIGTTSNGDHQGMNGVDAKETNGGGDINQDEGIKDAATTSAAAAAAAGAGTKKRPRGKPTAAQTTQTAQTAHEMKHSIMPDGDCGRFISATWLQSWADALASSPPPPIDNAPLLCPHGKLDPTRPSVMRRLPTHAWTALAGSYRGGPELTPRDACPICLGEVLDSIAAAEDSSEARDYYLDVAEVILSSLRDTEVEEGEEEEEDEEEGRDDVDLIEIMELEDSDNDKNNTRATRGGGGGGGKSKSKRGRKAKTAAAPAAPRPPSSSAVATAPIGGVPAYYISKSWLQAWQRRGGKSMGVTPPTQSLGCPHGGLLPEPSTTKAKSSKRIGISEDFWAFLKRSWQVSEMERLRKARAKAADKIRKNQGGAAVLDGDKDKEKKKEDEEEESKDQFSDGDMEMIEIDGEQVFIPREKKEIDRKTSKKKEEEEDDIQIIDETTEAAAAEDAAGGDIGTNATNNATINTTTNASSSITLEVITPLPEFPIRTTEACLICRAEFEEAARVSRGLHTRVQAEKSSLAHLLSPGFLQLTQGETYYLIPRAFMEHWRAYMTQASAGRRGAAAAAAAAAVAAGSTAADILEAPSLADYMKRAACDCHFDPPLLAFAPPAVVNRRGRWLVVNNSENTTTTLASPGAAAAGGGTSGGGIGIGSSSRAASLEDPFSFFELLSLADWSAFIEHYAEEGLPFGIEGIKATLHIQEKEEIEKEKETAKEEAAAPAVVEVGVEGKDNGGPKEDEIMQDEGEEKKMETEIGEVKEDKPMLDAAKTKVEMEMEDEDAQLARALAVAEAEDAKIAAKENGELTEDEEEEEAVSAEGGNFNLQKTKNNNNRRRKKAVVTSPLPSSQVDDEGTVFGQDPDFLYERKPGAGGNAHLRPGAAGKAWLETVPPTCSATLEARHAAIKAAKLSYIGAELMVEICPTDDEAITATLAAVAAGKGGGGGAAGGGGRAIGGGAVAAGGDVGGERKSKRARKGRGPVTVDCTSTLNDLRLRIYQAVGVHPRNARLFLRGLMISAADDITLAELEIYPNEEIRVVDTCEHDPDDLTGLFASPSGGKKGRRGGPEGFGGTALTGLHLVDSHIGGGTVSFGEINDDIEME